MIRAVPIRILRQILLVVVRPEVGNPTQSPRLPPRLASTGRLSVDLDVVPAVDLHKSQNSRQRAVAAMRMRALRARPT